MMTLQPAQPAELSICLDIIRDGRSFQQEQGFTQWTEEYPSAALIGQDLQEGSGYLFRIDGEAAGYMYLGFDGDPDYGAEECGFQPGVPYAVVHRIALSRRFAGRGLSSKVFDAVKALCLQRGLHCIRIDTDRQNLRMQHVLEKNGFVRRGIVYFAGDPKLTYECMF